MALWNGSCHYIEYPANVDRRARINKGGPRGLGWGGVGGWGVGGIQPWTLRPEGPRGPRSIFKHDGFQLLGLTY